MAYYLVIAADLAKQYQGYTSGPNTFASTKTKDGRTVCAHTSLFEFPELFTGRRVTVVELEAADFPAPPPMPPVV